MFLAIIILVCVFVHRANRNLRALGAEGVHYTPGWAVGWFFVPLASLFVPYRVIEELWQASGRSPGSSWKALEPPRYFPSWWAAWIVAAIAAQVAKASANTKDLDGLLVVTVLSIVAAASGSTAAVLLAKIVGEIRRRQETRAEALDKLR